MEICANGTVISIPTGWNGKGGVTEGRPIPNGSTCAIYVSTG